MNKKQQLTNEDIVNAVYFLRRVVVYGQDAEVLIRTVEALEAVINRKDNTHE